MAKMTALAALNDVLRQSGEDVVVDLATIDGISIIGWKCLVKAVYELAYAHKFKPLEATGTITLATATNTHAQATDMHIEDEHSFRAPDSGNDPMNYLVPDVWDVKYPTGISTNDTGYPTAVRREAETFEFNKYANAASEGKLVYYRYWKIPTIPDTAIDTTGTGTFWVPEGFDRTTLVDLATHYLLAHKGNPNAGYYWGLVYGVPAGPGKTGTVGSFDKMKKAHSSPRLSLRISGIL